MLERFLFLCLVAQCLSSFPAARGDAACPAQQVVAPCTCSGFQRTTPALICQGLQNAAALTGVISRLQTQSFEEMRIGNSNLENLAPDAFRGIRVKKLNFKFVEMTNFGMPGRPALMGLENFLEVLQIAESFRKYPLKTFTVAHLKRLYYLSVQAAMIESIPNDWFESGPYSLRELYLVDNSVKELGSHAFASLHELKGFWFTGNAISQISRDILPNPASKLADINLSDNQLKSLPQDMFTGMPSLRKLDLQNNGFTIIVQEIFKPVWSQLQIINFSGNPLVCDSKLRWITIRRSRPASLKGKCTHYRTKRTFDLRKLRRSDV